MLLAALVAAGHTGCGPQEQSSGSQASSSRWQFEGNLALFIVDYDDGRKDFHEHRYELQLGEDESIELLFDEDPELDPEIRLGVTGTFTESGKLRVTDYGVVKDGLGTLRQALIDATPVAPKSIAVLLVAPGGATDNETVASMNQKVFTGNSSTRAYYDEASYGIESLVGDVYGWFSVSADALNGCNTSGLATQARDAAQRAGVNLSQYSQIMYYFPRNSACSWAGLAQVGRPLVPARDSWYNGSSGCVVLAHELGHNYGLMHSGSYSCGSSALLNNPDSSCDRSEYGDPFCPMGGGCWHFQAYQKTAMGWLQECNLVDVRHDGSFALEPIEMPTNGIQSLRVRLNDDEYLYLDYRQPIGFDANPRNTQGSVFHGVLIRVAPYSDGDATQRPSREKPHILDMTPQSQARDHDDSALQVGESWTTPDGNVTITVDAADEARAQVRIEFADGGSEEAPTTCLDGSVPPVGVVGGTGDGSGDDDGDGSVDPGTPGTGDVTGPYCVELPEWSPGTTNAVVQHNNHKYTCISADLCSLDSEPAQAAYEPGVGYSWHQAWANEGECEPPPPDPGPGIDGDGPGFGDGDGGPGDGAFVPGGPGGTGTGTSPSDESSLVGRWSCSANGGSKPAPVGAAWALLGLAALGLRRRSQGAPSPR